MKGLKLFTEGDVSQSDEIYSKVNKSRGVARHMTLLQRVHDTRVAQLTPKTKYLYRTARSLLATTAYLKKKKCYQCRKIAGGYASCRKW
ncbi:unnamed protein product [Tenebrio molitor]|nr:unnamed protein product [Tenebrio molitor]